MDLRARVIAWREAHGLPPPCITNPDHADASASVDAEGGAAILKPEVSVSELDLVFVCDCTGRSVLPLEWPQILALSDFYGQYGLLHSHCAKQHYLYSQRSL